jgi:diguanylate cyclase (GGDEF)-like protein/PAS domain S-box-containing protein
MLIENNYRLIVDSLYDGLYLVDRNRVITYWNKAAEKITGFPAEEVIGKSCADHILTHVDVEGNTLCLGLCPLAESISDGGRREAEVYLHHKKGHRIPVSVRVSAIRDQNGEIVGGVELFSDISSKAANELRIKELEKLAFLDNLTQLANRHYLQRELELRFEEYKRYSVPFGVLLMDIDFFKKFNDNYGHDVGDMVLKTVANTCISHSRPFDLYGRWGGEEFLCIIRNVNSKDLELMANRLRVLIENSYIIYNQEKLKVTISIGATTALAEDNLDGILKRADTLLYASKNGGRNMVTLG